MMIFLNPARDKAFWKGYYRSDRKNNNSGFLIGCQLHWKNRRTDFADVPAPSVLQRHTSTQKSLGH